jgi:predicted DNA-binding transcriptional regulator AlpA
MRGERTMSDHSTAHPTPVLVSERDAAQYISMSIDFLRHARMQGSGPSYIRLGRSIRYRVESLDRWLDERMVRTRVA